MSSPDGKVLVVMPAMNEEAVIGDVISEVRQTLPKASILVVNDGSTDQTSQIAKAAGVTTLDLPFNLGVGGAMRAGFKYAAANNFDVMVQLDSDGQHKPSDVPRLVSELAEHDVVIGARFAGEGDYKVRGPRAWAMKFLSTVLSRYVGARLTDTTSGFKAHGRRAIDLYRFDFPAEYLGDTVEAIVIGHKAGLTFTQVPVSMRERLGGTASQNGWRSTLYLVRLFLALILGFLQSGRRR